MDPYAIASLPARKPPLWRNLSFTLMWSSTAASGFGDRMIMLAAAALLGIHLGSVNGVEVNAASINAGIYFWFFLPYFFLGLVGGWIADTLPRKWVLFSCDEIRGVLLLAVLLIVPATGNAALDIDLHWQVFAMLFGIGFLASVFTPTRNATIPQIVPMGQLQSANAIIMCIAVVFSLLGMGIGGLFIKGEDAQTVHLGILIGAVLYLGSGWFFVFLRPRRTQRIIEPVRRSEAVRLIEAFSYICRHKRILRMILLSMLFWAAAYIMLSATAAFTKDRWMNEGDSIIAKITFLQAFLGLGMLLGAIFMSAIATRRESFWLGLIGMLVSALSMVLMALCPWYWLAMVLCFMAGFFGNMSLVVINTLTQSLSADYIRGRVFGIRDVTDNAANISVNLVIWQMPHADAWMMPALLGCAMLLLIVALYGLAREMPLGPLPTAWTNVVTRMVRIYVLVWHRAVWVDRHHVPTTGPVLLAPNHTTGLDPFLIQPAVPRLIRWVMLTRYRYWPLEPLWRRIHPVCLDLNNGDLGQLRRIVQVLRDEEVVGLFPEGQLQREQRQLQPLMPGIGMMVRRGDAVIVPVWIDGTPRTRSMIWHFLRPSHSIVIFGPPWKPDRGMSDEAVTAELRERLLALEARLHAEV